MSTITCVNRTSSKQFLKAAVVLVLLYLAAFLMATHEASQNTAEAAPQQGHAHERRAAIDPAKEADLRALMELLGVHDMAEQAAAEAAEQYRQTLSASLPDTDSGRQFVNSFVDHFQRRFNPDEVADELVSIYDRHFNGEDIKGLLVFYGSPLGQKYAVELPKISSEAQAVSRNISTRVAHEVLEGLKRQYPALGAEARLVEPSPSPAEMNERQP